MASFEPEDVTAILRGVFDINVKLGRISGDVQTIRRALEEDDGEEEPEEDVDR